MQQEIPPLLGAPTNEELGIPGWLEPLLWVTVIIVALWLASSIFIQRLTTFLSFGQLISVPQTCSPNTVTAESSRRPRRRGILVSWRGK